MNQCIYTGDGDAVATFNSAEHIIPKCVGGFRCLPKGWVSDKVNNGFSALELNFARHNPAVSIFRMFSESIGRKKHKNRQTIGVMTSTDGCHAVLGYITGKTPFPVDQVYFEGLSESSLEHPLEVRVTLAPSNKQTNEKLIRNFFFATANYNGCPSPIKSKVIPLGSYIVGHQDNRWFLGLSDKENPEVIKPLIQRAMMKVADADVDEFIQSDKVLTKASEHVTAHFEMAFNYLDCFRVYAKIALNSLAFLRGQQFLLSPNFQKIKETILDGANISDYCGMVEGENVVRKTFADFPDRIQFGEHFHSVVFCVKDGVLYGFVALFGTDNPVMVQLGEVSCFSASDVYICDWENKIDYKMIDCVKRICRPCKGELD
jgi:hypothetical protein